MPRRPPDILRKSHAHEAGNARSRDKRALAREVDAAIGESAGEAGLLVDLDGVVYERGSAVAGAPETVAWLRESGMPHLFVTNTTSRPRRAIVERLAGFGIAVSAEEILTPPVAAAGWLAEHGARRLAAFVPAQTRGEFADFELAAPGATEAVDAVVIGDYGEGWSFAELNRAFRLLMRTPQPQLVALGMTRYWQAPDGLRLDTAPFVTALAEAASAEPVVLGKPAPAFFAAALERLGVASGRAWMIGDDLRADVEGAQRFGLGGILVRTGKFRPTDLAQGVEPDLVLDSIADLPSSWPPADFHRRRESR